MNQIDDNCDENLLDAVQKKNYLSNCFFGKKNWIEIKKNST